MKLKELKSIIDHAIESDIHAANYEVGIEIWKPGTVGGTPMVEINHANLGFDWDHGRLIISTKKKIAEVPDAIKMMEDWVASQKRMLERTR